MRSGVPRGSRGHVHEAGFYASDEEFLTLILPFVTEGTAAGEPVVIGYDARKCDLLRAALPGPEGVTFIEDASLYATPARAIEAYREQFERGVAAGAEQIRIAGDVPHEGNGGRFDGWDRYESAVNVVWQDYPVLSRCLYDATSVSADVRDVVERTHRRLHGPGGVTASPRFQEPAEFEQLPPAPDPLERTAPAVRLADASLKRTRRRVAEAARGRLDDRVREDLLFAVTEAVVNAQLHGRPPVEVRVWTGPDRVVLTVHDAGSGPPDRLTGLVAAPRGTTGAGLGLWLVHQLPTVDVALRTAPGGFTVRLRAGAPPPCEDRTAPTGLATGAARGQPPGRGGVHLVDGDGASLCGLVDAPDLDLLEDGPWLRDVPADRRCLHCWLLAGAPSGRS